VLAVGDGDRNYADPEQAAAAGIQDQVMFTRTIATGHLPDFAFQIFRNHLQITLKMEERLMRFVTAGAWSARLE
jgi:hypothetical protein